MYGISIDESMGSDEFEYLVEDNYNPAVEIPEGFGTKVIPAYTWAVFACRGEMPQFLQDVNKKNISNGCQTAKTTRLRRAAILIFMLHTNEVFLKMQTNIGIIKPTVMGVFNLILITAFYAFIKSTFKRYQVTG